MTEPEDRRGGGIAGPALRRDPGEPLCVHILSASAALVGVCLTLIGLFRVVLRIKDVDELADDLLAIDAMGFLIACFCAYGSLRARTARRRHRLEQVADVAFLCSLAVMVVVGSLITWHFV